MVFYLISLHQVSLLLGIDLPLWQISWKWSPSRGSIAVLVWGTGRAICPTAKPSVATMP